MIYINLLVLLVIVTIATIAVMCVLSYAGIKKESKDTTVLDVRNRVCDMMGVIAKGNIDALSKEE